MKKNNENPNQTNAKKHKPTQKIKKGRAKTKLHSTYLSPSLTSIRSTLKKGCGSVPQVKSSTPSHFDELAASSPMSNRMPFASGVSRTWNGTSLSAALPCCDGGLQITSNTSQQTALRSCYEDGFTHTPEYKLEVINPLPEQPIGRSWTRHFLECICSSL